MSIRAMMNCREVFVPAANCIAIYLTNEGLTQLGKDAPKDALFTIYRTLLNAVL
jgi:hypothetical protein